jgi:uncharacterized protein
MASAQALDPVLLEVLVCPKDRGPLIYFADEDALYNPRLRLRYKVRDGIPNMLTDEADELDEAEHTRLTAKSAAGSAQTTGSAQSGAELPEETP